MAFFQNRVDAGRQLAQRLMAEYGNRSDVVVLALPRGGVPVAFEVAQQLRAPMDVFLVRKLGVPGQEELAMGAIATGGVRVVNPGVVRSLGISEEAIEAVAAQEQRELARRERAYRGDHPALDVRERVAILVDDGLATGASMRAAVTAVRLQKPSKVVVAVPVAAPDTCRSLEPLVDEIICLETPAPFFGVGAWYRDFSQLTDDQVRALLERAQEIARAGQAK
ncbi:MAG: phosphoribosyltransferase [Chloroflexi bacterium]|jgi:putative phosphoribosyl transferase|nr:phosphoribosyltransferase [Chloroflexota bacterium]